MNKQRKFIVITAAIGVIAMFLPWVDILFLSVNGMHGIGILVFLCFLACVVIALMGDRSKNLDKTMWLVALVAGGLAAVVMLISFLQAMDVLSLYGIGFYLALLASLALVFVTYNYRSSGYNIKDGFNSLKNDINDKTKAGGV